MSAFAFWISGDNSDLISSSPQELRVDRELRQTLPEEPLVPLSASQLAPNELQARQPFPRRQDTASLSKPLFLVLALPRPGRAWKSLLLRTPERQMGCRCQELEG